MESRETLLGCRGTRGLLVLIALVAWTSLLAAGIRADDASLPAVATPGSAHSACASCHVGSPDGVRRLPDSTRCVQCHGGQLGLRDAFVRNERSGGSIGHLTVDGSTRKAVAPGGPTRIVTLDCLACHAAHPNGQRHQLRDVGQAVQASGGLTLDATSRVCVDCHVSFADFGGPAGRYRRHPVGVTIVTSRSEETEDEPAIPVRLSDIHGTESIEDDVVGCASCHEVHASSNPSLLRWKPEDQSEACGSCHADRRPTPRVEDRALLTAFNR